jgi:thioredoxin 1
MKSLLILIVSLFLLGSCTKADLDPNSPAKMGTSPAKVTFIELGSVNCIPCIKMQGVMKEAGKQYAQHYRIRVIPTQVLLDEKGNEYFRHEGYFPKEELVQILRQKGVR